MSIWKKSICLTELNFSSKHSLVKHLNIQYTKVEDSSVTATMPVNQNTHQPFGQLHGGASIVLAETLGSLGANLCVDDDHYCVGLDINANHIKSISSGYVTGVARPLHLGRKTQVWQIEIKDDFQQLICTSRITMMVLPCNKVKTNSSI